MRHFGIRTRLGLASLLLLSGCGVVGPDFTAPDASWSPASWFHARPAAPVASVPTTEAPDPHWWTILRDPTLAALESRLAGANLDVQAAALRLDQARAALGVAGAAGAPKVNFDAAANRNQQSRDGTLRLTNSQSGGLGRPYSLYQAGFDAGWELDLWGRVKRGVEQASAQADASQAALDGVLVTAEAELARDYIQLRGVQAKLGIAAANLKSARESLALTRARAAGGLTNDLDVANAAAQADAVAASIPELERQRDTLANAIALLLGQPPGAAQAELAAGAGVPVVPPHVPVGVPADLVRRRPDVRQAEATLHAATAGVGVATADFYPRITLVGSGMIQGLQPGNLADWAGHAYGFGPSVTLPIFDGGRLERTLELRKAEQKEAAVLWRAKLLGALHEVDDALTAYGTEQRRRALLASAADAARRAAGLARQRYEAGVADFLQVLTAQRAQLAAEQDLADSTTAVATGLVQIYKALGGGWN